MIALALHPRGKLKFVKWLINQSFDIETTTTLKNKLEYTLKALFDE